MDFAGDLVSTESEFAGDADRASSVVHEQIVAMIDSARGAALVIERRARNADEERRRADEQAAMVLETLRGVESELGLLLTQVGREADALTAALERSRLRAAVGALGAQSAPTAAREPAPTIVLDEAEEPPDEKVAQIAGEQAEQELPPAEPEPPVPEPKPPVAEPEQAAAPETEAEPPAAEPAALPAAVASDLDEEARSRVAAKSDLELAELHQIASGRAGKGSDDQRAYWQALVSATIAEAAKRETFGEQPDGENPRGRWAKKRRAKALQPLVAAREAARREAERP